jgi:hypothetical protein
MEMGTVLNDELGKVWREAVMTYFKVLMCFTATDSLILAFLFIILISP